MCPDDRVLEIGCGPGRVAVALTAYLSPEGSYDGIDVASEPIAWAERAITSRFPNFRFTLADLETEMYNPTGAGDASTFKFPYPDANFDFAFLTSVFTHMLPAESANYLHEVARMARPGGTLFATWFIISPEEPPLPSAVPHFVAEVDGYAVIDEGKPRAAVGYKEDDALAMYRAAGFTTELHHGYWSGRHGLEYQDIIIGRLSTD
jgi:ubiquinone/menaquinone biosynthesis C-methylase UbiE